MKNQTSKKDADNDAEISFLNVLGVVISKSFLYGHTKYSSYQHF